MTENFKRENPDQNLIASSDFLNNAKIFWRTQFIFDGRYVICGSKDHVEIHQIHHIHGHKEEGFKRIMSLYK